eukprot:TRINITY_DN2680_c0_g2_i3.p1 TRINITY_DN2680_c0_g2~~TRINITY_DN2680_c0_g2_i3.p1  ORF type:complete len:173 (-),score=34.99 TRINITY_DN2680_c0_g2_i3:468-986(-)
MSTLSPSVDDEHNVQLTPNSSQYVLRKLAFPKLPPPPSTTTSNRRMSSPSLSASTSATSRPHSISFHSTSSPAPPDTSSGVNLTQSLPSSPLVVKSDDTSYCAFCSLSGVRMKLTITGTDAENLARFCRKCSRADPPSGSKICLNPTCRQLHLPDEESRRCKICGGQLFKKK